MVKKRQFWVVISVVKQRQFRVFISVVKNRPFWVVCLKRGFFGW